MDKIKIRYQLNQAYMDGDVCADCSVKRGDIYDDIYCTGRILIGPNKYGEGRPRPLGKVPCQLWENAWARGYYG